MRTQVRHLHLSSTAFALVALGCPSSGGNDDGCETTECSSTDGTTEAGTSSSGVGSSSSAPDDTTSASASSSSGADSDSGDDSSADSSGDPPSMCADPTADGLVLGDVSLFQTIAVPLAEDCAAIDPADRVAPIVAGHVAKARATVTLGADWAAADLVARVDLESSAGSESFVGDCTSVAAGEATADLHVEIPAASIHADTDYAVSVASCDGTVLAAFPDSGSAELGAETTGVFRLHLVPFEVGGFVPDTSQAVLDGYRDALLAYYPITDVEITVAPLEPDDNGGQVDMGGLLIRLIQIQDADVFGDNGLDPAMADIYYYGMVTGAATREEFCDDCPTGTSESGLGDRAGSAVGAAFADALAESTLVHEMGHTHGLLHSPCGEPSSVDEEFPYDDGATHTEGWDFRSDEFIPPTHNDLMGYCQPRWVSDYNYRKLVDWVQLAATWGDGMQALAPASMRSLTRTQCTPQ